MALPGMDPAAALKQISQEVQEKFDEAGMGKVEEFTDKIDDIIAKAKDGPKKMMEEAKAKFQEFKDKIDEMMKNPGSLAPGGAAACAEFYGKAVVGKLSAFNDEAMEMATSIGKVATEMEAPLKQLGETLEKAMSQLEGSLKALAKLPKLISQEISGKDSPDDIAKINCDPMKKCLSVGDVDGPLNMIKGLKDVLGGAVEAVKKGIAALADFITSAPDKAPPAMKTLLEMVDKLKGIELQPIIDMLDKTTDTIGNLDTDQVKNPMNKFLESAGGLVDKLENTVKGAKLAGNPAAAIGSMV